MGLKLTAAAMRGWMPIRFYWHERQPMVDWCLVDDLQFTDPFFEQTIARAMLRPFHVLFRRQTPIEFLGELDEEGPPAAPDGFIYHMSRCGSTLISRMLAALPETRVISEAGPIDAVLQSAWKNAPVTDEQRGLWLRWMVGALGRGADGAAARYFVKLDCWHMLEIDLIRRAFPATPWIFVYRNPVEVMVSQMRQPAFWTLPGTLNPARFGMDVASILQIGREEYCGRVLAEILRCAISRLETSDGFLVAYPELPEAVWSSVGRVFGTDFSAHDLDLMNNAAQFDAKSPSFSFAADSTAKLKEASEPVRRVCEKSLDPLYQRLKGMRLVQRLSSI